MTADGAAPARRPFVLIVTEDRAVLAAVAGALAIFTGSALTWATVPLGFSTVAVSGLEANGKITIVLGVLALLVVAASVRMRGKDLPVVGALLGLASAGVAVAYLRDLKSATALVLQRALAANSGLDPTALANRIGAHAGPGVWTVFAGGALLAAAALTLLVRDRGVPRG